MTPHVNLTFDALARSRNEAATATLVAVMDGDDSSLAEWAVKALAVRRSKAGHVALLRRWSRITELHSDAIQEARGRMGGALRDALLGEDDDLFGSSCAATEYFCEFDVLPTLIAIAEHAPRPRRRQATALVHRLVDQLGSLLHAPRGESDSRDPQQIRGNVLESLERSVERFRQHKCEEIIEAFVTLAGPGSQTLASIVDAPHHPCFQSVVNTFSDSKNPSVIQLLLSYMKRPDAPRIVRNVVSKRTDVDFVQALLACPVDPSNTTIRQNLSRITAYVWQRSPEEILPDLSAERQAVAVQLVMLSGVPTGDALTFYRFMLRHGLAEARCAVCSAVEQVYGDRADNLILFALDDEEPSVQAAAARQIRQRQIKGAAAKLVERLDSPHDEVREAVREALSEFSFENYVAKFDDLDEQLRGSTGDLVRRIDAACTAKLRVELGGPLRAQRRRAIEMAQTMGLLPKVSDAVVELLADEDPTIREAAAQALQHCTGSDVRAALVNVLQDSSASVQTAAQESLAEMAGGTAGDHSQSASTTPGRKTS